MVERVGAKGIEVGERLIEAGPRLRQRARVLAGVAAFVEDVLDLRRVRLAKQAPRAVISLHRGEADLGGEGEHVGG